VLVPPLDAGLWLFSRKPVDPAATAVMREQAQKLGFDLSVLKKVQQDGCSYPSTSGSASASSNSGSGGNSGSNSGNRGNSGGNSGQQSGRKLI
jgi:hypothetical protein